MSALEEPKVAELDLEDPGLYLNRELSWLEFNQRVIELAEEVFHAPVRLGLPQGVSGLVDVVRNPIHSTGVGLLLFGRENYVRRGRGAPVANGMRSVVDRMKAWFQGNF